MSKIHLSLNSIMQSDINSFFPTMDKVTKNTKIKLPTKTSIKMKMFHLFVGWQCEHEQQMPVERNYPKSPTHSIIDIEDKLHEKKITKYSPKTLKGHFFKCIAREAQIE